MIVVAPSADLGKRKRERATRTARRMGIEFGVIRMRRMRIACDPHADAGVKVLKAHDIPDMNGKKRRNEARGYVLDIVRLHGPLA